MHQMIAPATAKLEIEGATEINVCRKANVNPDTTMKTIVTILI
jgi:hypothetical protein